ncbi:MAG: alpha/beta fold hydrolase [Hyphomonadaceae bacterium JAD_PAG50586_4]|nr:MAG: alpha/beta fold hydrolase [Hyphomonadaceae bacterium JAD_PAG50586_4]
MSDLATTPLTLANGLRTRLLDTGGPGAPIVLLHGLALAIEIWGKVIPELARDFRVIAFDLPGFGQADRPDAAYDAAFFVEQVVAAMDALRLERAHIIGSSLGASTVVRMSVAHQHRIDRAIIMAPGGFGRDANIALRAPTLPLIGYPLGKPTWLSNAFALRLAMADKSLATRDLIDLMNAYTQIDGTHRSFVRTVKAGLGPFGVRERPSFAAAARGLQRPTLVLWGEQDWVFPAKQAKIASALIEGARVKRIEGCGHYPHWETPARFLAEVRAFLL